MTCKVEGYPVPGHAPDLAHALVVLVQAVKDFDRASDGPNGIEDEHWDALNAVVAAAEKALNGTDIDFASAGGTAYRATAPTPVRMYKAPNA